MSRTNMSQHHCNPLRSERDNSQDLTQNGVEAKYK